MIYRQFITRFIRSFPVQLVVMHFKKNQIMMLYWLLLFGFITETISKKYGIPFLFLDPEYMGHVGNRAFFIIGLCLGAFIMAFNITSFILNSFRFPFLATLSRTFMKYSHNNFIIPGTFVLVYCIRIFDFQHNSQLKEVGPILLNIFVFLIGIISVMYFTLRYFMVTNKDIYKLFGVEHADNDITSPAGPYSTGVKKNAWRVDTYLAFPFKVKLVRDARHYKRYMLEQVFRQNHINAAVVELVVFITFIVLGLFRDYPLFRIPAGGSVLLLFTMLLMLSGVFRYWLRAWANTALIIAFIALNFFSQFESINPRNQAYGLNYTTTKAVYSREKLEEQVSPEILKSDINHTVQILERWKKKWADRGVEKPKMVLLNVSGGGVRSCVFTFRTLQLIDSTYNGYLLPQTTFISGSSGGMISACYYRELFLTFHDSLMKANQSMDNRFLLNTGKDLLNSIAFSATVADLFMNVQQFSDGKYRYAKDRAYAFEEQLMENTGQLLDKRLRDYYQPEVNADIPMLVIAPTIINDGRVLQISPQPVSYLLQEYEKENEDYNQVANGVDFQRFFAEQDAANLKISSALRMNSAFPYVMPAISLPSEPAMEVMDAGIRDNYGIMNSIQFLYTFREWIAENTSGVVMVQIRDTHKKPQVEDNSVKTIIEKLMAPMRNLSGNFLIMQDYSFDRYLGYAKSWYKGPLDFVVFQMPETDEKISLSWHLTEREKKFLKGAALNPENRKALEKLKRVLPPEFNNLPIASKPKGNGPSARSSTRE
ncbi:hypothetical protein BH11BAC2_BH11BAC2_21190 [soil metagenome]